MDKNQQRQMPSELWQKSTNKICIGVGLYYFAPVFAFIFSLIDGVSAFSSFMNGGGGFSFSLTDIFKYLPPIGAVLFFLGLKQFKNAVDKADQVNIIKVSNSVIILIAGSLIIFVPVFGSWIAGVLNIIAMVIMIGSFSGLKVSQTFPEFARKGASRLHTAMILTIVAILIGWIPLIGFIGSIVSFIAMFFTANGWKTIAGDRNGAFGEMAAGTTNIGSIPEPEKKTDEYITIYKEVEQKSDKEIDSVLTVSTSMLNPLYVGVLKDVQNKRIELKKLNEERKVFYDEAITKTDVEIEQYLLNSKYLNSIGIKTLCYLQRCSTLEIKPCFESFLLTFELGYIEPETPTEKKVRIKKEVEMRIKQKNSHKQTKKIIIIVVVVLAIIAWVFYSYQIMEIHAEDIYIDDQGVIHRVNPILSSIKRLLHYFVS